MEIQSLGKWRYEDVATGRQYAAEVGEQRHLIQRYLVVRKELTRCGTSYASSLLRRLNQEEIMDTHIKNRLFIMLAVLFFSVNGLAETASRVTFDQLDRTGTVS